MKDIVRRCHVVYVVMGVVVVASGSSPSAYILGLIRRIDRGDPNESEALSKGWPRYSDCTGTSQIQTFMQYGVVL